MREVLADIIKHTQGVGFFTDIRVSNTGKEAVIEAMESGKTVVMEASILEPFKDITGDFGLGRLSILQGYLNFPNYKTDDATITVNYKDRGDKKNVPEDMVFNDGNGQKSVYRFMSYDMIPYAKFTGTKWDVKFEPSRTKIQEFQTLAGILGSNEPYFLAKTEDGKLKFLIGEEDSASDRTEIVMSDSVDGELKGDLYWPSDKIISILKLGMDENPVIEIMNRGALQITITSSKVKYKFILPARRR